VSLGPTSPATSVVEHRHGNVTVTLQPVSATLSSVRDDTGDEDDDYDDYDDDYDDGGSGVVVSDTSTSFSNVINKSFEGHGAAVIALSFGISITAVLIIFASCHFCRRRRGSWKGRRLHIGETDYLVDGMYL